MFGSGGAGAAWFMGQNLGAGIFLVGALDELIVVQKSLRRN